MVLALSFLTDLETHSEYTVVGAKKASFTKTMYTPSMLKNSKTQKKKKNKNCQYTVLGNTG